MLFKLAWRNIYRNKRRTFLTILMMTFGYVLFSFFISIADGAYGNIIQKFIQERTGNIQIHAKGYLDTPRINRNIKNYEDIQKKIMEQEGVRAVSLRVKGGALAFGKKKSLGVEVVGVIPELEEQVTTLKGRVNIGTYFSDNTTVIIGKKISKVLNLKLGDELILISQGADGGIANDLFKVGGIISPKDDGVDDNTVYMSLARSQEFFTLYGRVHEYAIALNNQNLDEIVDGLKIKLSADLEVNSWKEVEQDFFRAMEADRKGDFIARMIFMVVIAIGVLNTVLMSILERKREFGVLKAIGTRPSNIFGLITIETSIMAFIAIFIGFLIALVLNYYFSIVGIAFEPFEYGGMRFDKMVTILNIRCFVIPIYTVLGSSVFVSIFPAMKAAKVTPVEAMREL